MLVGMMANFTAGSTESYEAVCCGQRPTTLASCHVVAVCEQEQCSTEVGISISDVFGRWDTLQRVSACTLGHPSRRCPLIQKLVWEVIVDQTLSDQCHGRSMSQSGGVPGVGVAERRRVGI